MAKNVTVTKGRGPSITREQESEFLDWLARTGSPEQAAALTRVSWNSMRQRKARNKRFRAAWELARGDKHRELVEDFFVRLEASAEAKSSYLAAGLTESWYYYRMVKDDAFRNRVKRTIGIKPNEIAQKIVTLAKSSDSIPDLIKVLDRMMGNNTPGTPRGG